MPGHLSTHVLDTARWPPCRRDPVPALAIDGDTRRLVAKARPMPMGAPRAAADAATIRSGPYSLEYDVAPITVRRAVPDRPPFLDVVTLRFNVSALDQHYHIPLLLSPYGYTTYRGS